MRWVLSRPAKGSLQNGATLIELVVSIVLFAFASSLLFNLFFSQSRNSVEPMFQIRAAELGQALMDEVLAKRYDHLTPLGGVPPCVTCTAAGSLGPEGAESRTSYNDVDDYHFYCGPPNSDIKNSLAEPPKDFHKFKMSICVYYDGDYDGVVNEAGATEMNAKQIVIDIFPPSGAGIDGAIRFVAYRSNF